MSATTLAFESDDVMIAADRRGDPADPPVFFLHGGGQTRHSWGAAAAAVAEHGWCTYTLDSRGHGESDWSPDARYALRDFARDLLHVADQVGADPVVVGASLGGLTSLLAMGRERLGLGRGLVLVDIVPEMEQTGTDRIKDFMAAHVETGFGSLGEAAEAVAAYNPRPDRSVDPESLRKNLRERDGRWYWHWDPRFMQQMARSNPDSELFEAGLLTDCARAIAVPKLLIRGRMSDVVTEEAARRFVDAVPGTGYVDVADAAHMVAGDKNDVFRSAVIEFVNGLRGST
ncbi:MAG: alpha/beta hydrolase [Actinomycetota bacterium]